MPPENLGRDTAKSNVYAVMLVLACVFTLLGIILAFIELKEDYGMYGGKGRMHVEEGDDLLDATPAEEAAEE